MRCPGMFRWLFTAPPSLECPTLNFHAASGCRRCGLQLGSGPGGRGAPARSSPPLHPHQCESWPGTAGTWSTAGCTPHHSHQNMHSPHPPARPAAQASKAQSTTAQPPASAPTPVASSAAATSPDPLADQLQGLAIKAAPHPPGPGPTSQPPSDAAAPEAGSPPAASVPPAEASGRAADGQKVANPDEAGDQVGQRCGYSTARAPPTAPLRNIPGSQCQVVRYHCGVVCMSGSKAVGVAHLPVLLTLCTATPHHRPLSLPPFHAGGSSNPSSLHQRPAPRTGGVLLNCPAATVGTLQ